MEGLAREIEVEAGIAARAGQEKRLRFLASKVATLETELVDARDAERVSVERENRLEQERDRLRELARKLLPQCSCGISPDGICERCAALNEEGGLE